MRKRLPVLLGLAGALLVSGTAEAALTGLKFTVKQSINDPRLFICNLYVTFSAVGDNLIAIVGLPIANGPPLNYSTNSVLGFHQETGFGQQDQPLNSTFRGFPGGNLLEDDTYFTIGLKHGYAGTDALQTAGLTNSDIPPGALDWNLPGTALESNAIAGGAYFVTPGAAQAVEIGGQVLIAQLVIDGNASTTDGLAARIDVFIPEITWADINGVSTSTTGLFSLTHVPAPGTLALLGLAGLFGIRRRRR